MKLNRMVATALALSLSLSLLAGCAPKEPEVTTPDVSTETTTPDTTTPEMPEVSPETPELGGEEDLPVAPLPDEETEEDIPNGDITMSRSDFTLFNVDDSYRLTLSNLIDSDVVTFSSADEAVATVAEDGTVTAVGAGTTTVTATILLDGITAVERTSIVRCDIEIPEVVEPAAPQITVSDFFAQLMTDFVSTSTLMSLEGEMLAGAYPGLADVNTLQCAVYAPMMSFAAMELALVQVADAADIDTVKAIFQTRIDAQVAGGAWYPAAIEGWQNHSHIVTSGNYVFMVVTSGYQETAEDPIIETAQEFIDAFEAAF